MERGVPVVAYGAAAVPETMGGAGLATRTRDPVEVAQLLAVLERDPKLRQKITAGQRARIASLGQEQVAGQIREGLEPWLEGALLPRARPVGSPGVGVDLVCPGYVSQPQAPASILARELVRRLPEARVLTLSPATPLLSTAPWVTLREGCSVWQFSPDQPLPSSPDADLALPGSSSLELAVRTSAASTVFLDAGDTIARNVLPHVQARAWAMHDAAAPVPAEARALEERLIPYEAEKMEAAILRLMESLRRPGAPHAR
jgi:hypothetical protein